MTPTIPRADGRFSRPVLNAARRLARRILEGADALVGPWFGAPEARLVPVRGHRQGRRGTLQSGASAGAGRQSEDAA